MSTNEARSARPPLTKLAAVLGRGVSSLDALDCASQVQGRYKGRFITVMGHTLPSIYLRVKRSRVCPECVQKYGFIESFWELSHAVACPEHGRLAVQICHACHHPLQWQRQGLLVCKCGHDFSNQRGDAVQDPAMLALLGMIRAKLRREPLDVEMLAKYGFPYEPLQRMALATLLGIIFRIEHSPRHLSAYENRPGVYGETTGLHGVTDILTNWPHGFYDYLDRVHTPHVNREMYGLRGQFNSIYESLFKNGLPRDEVAFMREAFVDFGRSHWKGATIHPRLAGKEETCLAGIGGLAQKLKVQPSTARRLVKNGLIEPTVESRKSGRLLFDLSQPLPLIPAVGASLGLREAANRIGLPSSILKQLREKGIYRPQFLAIPDTSFHEQDLDRFRGELLHEVTDISFPGKARHITLSEVMSMKLGSQEIKADFVSAVYARTLVPQGKTGNSPGRLVFDRSEVMDYLRVSQSKHSGLISTTAVANMIYCSSSVVRQLALDGILEYVEKQQGVYIKVDSLQQFTDQYISCAALGKKRGMGTLGVVHLCNEAGIEIVRFKMSDKSISQPFIHRKHEGLLHP